MYFEAEGVYFESEGLYFEREGLYFDGEGLYFEREGLYFDNPIAAAGHCGIFDMPCGWRLRGDGGCLPDFCPTSLKLRFHCVC